MAGKRAEAFACFHIIEAENNGKNMSDPKLTAMVMTLNEEAHLPECLARLAWADEMLVVDSFSTDRTVALAEAAGARVVQHPFADYSSQINWGFEQARGEWVLLIDADELVTPELRDSIVKTLAAEPAHNVYAVVRDAFFLERPMRASSWSNDRIPRLFRRGTVRYSGSVHQSINRDAGTVGLLDGKLLHHTYDSIEHYFAKIQRYTTLGARDAYLAGKRASLATIFLGSWWRFFHNYFLRGEILDGRMGLLSSGLAATYSFIKYAKMWGLADADRRRAATGTAAGASGEKDADG